MMIKLMSVKNIVDSFNLTMILTVNMLLKIELLLEHKKSDIT